MSTLKEWARLGAALVLIILGGIVFIFFQREEFGIVIGIGSVVIGLGFLWRSWKRLKAKGLDR
jgi:FtsH-binding integral membrane protein